MVHNNHNLVCPQCGPFLDFTDNDMEALGKVYNNLTNDQSVKQNTVFSDMKLGSHIPERIGNRLCRIMVEYSHKLKSYPKSAPAHSKHDSVPLITWTAFLTVLSHLLRGTTDQKSSILFHLSTDSEASSSKQINALMSTLLCAYFHVFRDQPANYSWGKVAPAEHMDLLCEHLLNGLRQSDSDLRCHDVSQWLNKCPLVAQIVQQFFEAAFGLLHNNENSKTGLMPLCKDIDAKQFQSILNVPAILFLNQHLPQTLRTEWRYLFSSRHYGESFSQFLGKVLKQGPTLLFVKDKHGHTFGGFASESWQLKPQFSGNSDCFLFSICPAFAVYETTGYNDHYMYLNLHQQTMPNGLGMGGQLDYFGLWLDSDYGKGKCTLSCSTYTCPQLSSCADFEVDTIEAWAVGPLPEIDKEEEDGKRSILDKVDAETKLVLNLVDRAPKSDFIREEDDRAT